jgi:NAD(P)-dependent dehydrogenase (short-subunit alcohol dehydrogenase family)
VSGDAGRPLEGQIALVTGAASGIGREIALVLAKSGATLALLDRDEERLRDVAIECKDGPAPSVLVYDLEQIVGLDAFIADSLDRLGGIDILVNCAGVGSYAYGRYDVFNLPDEVLTRTFAVNVFAPFVITKVVAARLVAQGSGGRIVNLSSSAAFRATDSPAGHYAASKGAINSFTRAAAGQLGEHGINVNAVAPGITITPMTSGMHTRESFEAQAASGPHANLLQRPSDASDVAGVVLFLCLPQSRQITGQVIHTSAGTIV